MALSALSELDSLMELAKTAPSEPLASAAATDEFGRDRSARADSGERGRDRDRDRS